MRSLLWCFAGAIGVAAGAGVAVAGDLNPPDPTNPFAPWHPSGRPNPDPNTTFNYWKFSTPGQNPEVWETYQNQVGSGFISNIDGSTWAPPGSPGAWDTNGVWSIPAGGFMDFTIPNFGPSTGPKFIYLQIKYSGVLPGWSVVDPVGGATGAHVPGGPVATPEPIGGGISYWVDTLMLPYNPQFEIVRIFNPSSGDKCFLTQVVIDTICVPTPGTAGLLMGVGLLTGARRRRTT